MSTGLSNQQVTIICKECKRKFTISRWNIHSYFKRFNYLNKDENICVFCDDSKLSSSSIKKDEKVIGVGQLV